MGLNGHKAIILVADDDEDDCLLIRDALEENGFRGRHEFVYDGKALMDTLYDIINGAGDIGVPDLILLDLNMPKKDGREALNEIKSQPKLRDIPVVILTTSSDSRDIELCNRLGASSYITKPMIFSEWVSALGALHTYLTEPGQGSPKPDSKE